MGLGGGSPLAMRLGGGRSRAQATYLALKSAVGVGGSSDDPQSLREEWRFAKARGLSCALADERASLQCSPQYATDFIPVYEDLLQMHFAPDVPEQARRLALTAEWVRTAEATLPTVQDALHAIEPTADVVIPPRELLRETQLGRAFEDHDPAHPDACGPAFSIASGASGPRCSSIPNFSDDFRWLVEYPVAPGDFNEPVRQTIVRLQAELNRTIPAWCSYTVFTASGGFTLDLDLLDVTVFG